jgi:hypothetical protein
MPGRRRADRDRRSAPADDTDATNADPMWSPSFAAGLSGRADLLPKAASESARTWCGDLALGIHFDDLTLAYRP